jgi:hypothetical protein
MTMEITIDPLKGYDGVKPTKLFEATGLIPYFVQEAALSKDGNTTAKEVMDIMNEAYGFGMGDYNMLENGGEVDDDGRYQYPEDPELVPLVQFELDTGVKVWVYQYALVAVVDPEGGQIMVRID